MAIGEDLETDGSKILFVQYREKGFVFQNMCEYRGWKKEKTDNKQVKYFLFHKYFIAYL